MNEQELIERVKQGDQGALLRYIDSRRAQLLAAIERKMSDTLRRRVEAEDILQDVCTSAVKSLGQVYLANDDPFPWLCYLAELRVIDAHRFHFGAQKRSADREVREASLGNEGARFAELLAGNYTSPSAVVRRNSRERKLIEALAKLSDEQSQILKLRYVENLSTKTIAERVGKSHGSLRTMLSRTLRQLQLILRDDGDFESLNVRPGR